MAEDGRSLRRLPPGKLQDLKKLFEGEGEPPIHPASPSRSISSIVPPRPTPHNTSAVRKTWYTSDESASNGKQSSYGKLDVSKEDGDSSEYCSPNKQNWFTSIERKSTVNAASRKKVSVPRLVVQFQDNVSSDVENSKDSVALIDSKKKPSASHRFVSQGARSGSPKRMSDPGVENEIPTKPMIKAKPVQEGRRRTVDNVDLGSNCNDNPNAMTVTNRKKLFENSMMSPGQDKPALPKKPPPPMPKSQNSHDTEDAVGIRSNTYEEPWDLASKKNLKLLEAISAEKSQQKISQVFIAGVNQSKSTTTTESTISLSPRAQPQKHVPRPTEQPPPPPYKPPRTFAHEDYLKVKVQKTSDIQIIVDQKSADTGKESGGKDESYNLSVRDCISVLTQKITPDNKDAPSKSAIKDRYSHASQRSETPDSKGVRERPPQRPPPPRPRTFSECMMNESPTKTLHSLTQEVLSSNTTSTSNDNGPIIWSTRKGRLSRNMSLSKHSRNPCDELPQPPGKGDSLQRFPLRKSLSSECLNKGSHTSVSDNMREDTSHGTLIQSYYLDSGEEDTCYEAVIDSEGYAVPNKFLRMPLDKRRAAISDPNSDYSSSKALHNFAFLHSNPSPPSVPPLPIHTPIKEQDIYKVPRKRLNLVRQKINQAYEVLNVKFRQQKLSEMDQGDVGFSKSSSEEQTSTDSDSLVDDTEIKRRVTYCSSVRLKTNQSVKKARDYMEMIYPQLFEYALIVGLCPKTDDPGYEPYIIHKFPQTMRSLQDLYFTSFGLGHFTSDNYRGGVCVSQMNSNLSVPKFCFPDADVFRPGTMLSTSETYSFVLTNIDGGHVYGYCRRMQPRDASLPEVICIISPVDAFNMYSKLLSEIEQRRLKSMDLAQEMMASAFGRPLPKPGKVCHIKSLDENGEMQNTELERPSDYRPANVNYESLICYLGTEKLIKVFSSMLMERPLIFTSSHLSILTQTIHALTALLYPFHWQHVFIPILPPDMLDVCAAPTPFIIGALQDQLPRILTMDLENVIVVDLDKKQLLRLAGDELTILPKKVQRALKTAINMCKVDADAGSSQWLMVSEAFLRMFVETIGHFGNHITTQQDGSKTFQKPQFIASAVRKSIRFFLEWFTETQMFNTFINIHLERQEWGSMDLFMSRLREQAEGPTEGSRQSAIGQIVKNIGKAIKTKLVI